MKMPAKTIVRDERALRKILRMAFSPFLPGFKWPDGRPLVIEKSIKNFLQAGQFQDHGGFSPKFCIEARSPYQVNVKNLLQGAHCEPARIA
jgi:hypothetical protein